MLPKMDNSLGLCMTIHDIVLLYPELYLVQMCMEPVKAQIWHYVNNCQIDRRQDRQSIHIVFQWINFNFVFHDF